LRALFHKQKKRAPKKELKKLGELEFEKKRVLRPGKKSESGVFAYF